MQKVHMTLASTHKEPELEKILRDLDQIAINTGLTESGGNEIANARSKTGFNNPDPVATHMKKAH